MNAHQRTFLPLLKFSGKGMATSNYQTAKAKVAVMEDAARVRRALKELDPAILRALDKANREAAKPIINDAIALTPETTLSNWSGRNSKWKRSGEKGRGTLYYDKADVVKGYKFRAGKKSSFSDYRALLLFKNMDPAGAIFEQVGRKSKGKTPQGRAFVRNLNQRFPRTSRLMWRAVDEGGLDTLQGKIAQNYEAARREVQAKIGRSI
jgi:hypothetical protein